MTIAHDIADAALIALPRKLAIAQAEKAEAAAKALADKIRDYGAEDGDLGKLDELSREAYEARLFAEEGDHDPHRYT